MNNEREGNKIKVEACHWVRRL